MNSHACRSMLTSSLALLLLSGSALGQSAWAAAVSGNWSVATNWTPVGVPNSPTVDVTIAQPGSYQVFCDLNANARSINLQSIESALRVLSGRTLTIGSGFGSNRGGATNLGTFEINDAVGQFGVAVLTLADGATINGPGPFALKQRSDGDYTAEIGAAAGAVATIGANATISGRGRITGTLTNLGTIGHGSGNGPVIYGIITQQGAGKLFAGEVASVGQAVSIASGSVTGGTIETVGAGIAYAYNGGSTNNVTLNGRMRVQSGSTHNILAGGFNVGSGSTLEVNDASGQFGVAVLSLADNATVNGPGLVFLRQRSDGDYTAEFGAAAGAVATIGANATITGRGRITGTLTNLGTIGAGPGNGPAIYGIVSQTGSGRLFAGEVASVGQAVSIASGSVTGGSIETSGAGIAYAYNGGSTSNVTLNGRMRVQPNSTHTIGAGGFVIGTNSTFEVNDAAGQFGPAVLELANGATLNGPGQILLRQRSDGDYTAELDVATGAVATIGANATISGRGRITGTLTNLGTIGHGSGNGPVIYGIITQQGAGKLFAGEVASVGQAVSIASGSVTGGTIETVGAGIAYAYNGGSTNNVTLNGRMRVQPNSTHTIGAGGFVIGANSTLELNDANGQFGPAILRLVDNATLSGPGPVVLRQRSDGDYTADLGTNASAVANIAPNAIVGGRGRLSGSLNFNGTLAPGSSASAGTILLNTTPLTLGSTSITEIELAGVAASQRDFLNVSGTAIVQLNGTLKLRFINGYRPLCLTYRFINGGIVSGVFTNVDLPATFPGWATVAYNSTGATLTYRAADYDRSGTYNVADIFELLNGWFANDPRADFNGFGGITALDIFDFLNAWFAGC